MKKLLVLVVILVLVGAASWAQSDLGTGQWLHDNWESYQRVINNTAVELDALQGSTYIGFVMAASRVMYDEAWLNLENTTFGQRYAVVGKYLDANPEQWNQPAEVLVYRALYAAWPGPLSPPSSLWQTGK